MSGEGVPIVVTGLARNLVAGGDAQQARFALDAEGLTIAPSAGPPISAAYRDLTTIAVDQGRLLLVLGGGASRVIAEQLGAGLGTLVAELRERRARQQLTDRFIQLPQSDRLEMVEYLSGQDHGVALIAYHPWGVALLPLDERQPWRLIRRADITRVEAQPASGSVSVAWRSRDGEASATLLGLGADNERHRAALAGLRDSALADAAAIVNGLLADVPLAARQRAAALLVDGRPVPVAELGEAQAAVERGVLADETYAATYAALIGRGGETAPRWLALAPLTPGDPGAGHIAWFLVGLPGDLVAFELVSEGAHATYIFRAQGSPAAAVTDISECLIDTRFLREPIYLTDTDLQAPDKLRYRFAIDALPALRAARARFVRRLIHTDDEAWAAALDDVIKTEGT